MKERVLVFIYLILLCSEMIKCQELKKINSDSLKYDVEFFFKTIEEVHPNMYAYSSKQVVDNKKQNLIKALDHSMSLLDFWKLFCPVVNSLFDGHTGVETFFNGMYNGTVFSDNFPEYIIDVKDQKLFFTKDFHLNGEDMSGLEILSINNYKSDIVVNKFYSYFPFERKEFKQLFIEIYFHYLTPIIFDSVNSNIFKYVNKEGETSVVTIEKTDGLKLQNDFSKIINLYFSKDYKSAMLTINTFDILKNDRNEFVNSINNAFDSIIKLNTNILFINIAANGGGQSINILPILNRIVKKKTKINDGRISIKSSDQIRQNHTKNSFNGENPNFFKILKDKSLRAIYWKKNGKITNIYSSIVVCPNNPFNGKVYLIQGRGTFSASVDLCSIIKHNKFATIIGEETGGITAGYIDSYVFKLPNSGLNCKCSYKFFREEGGCVDNHGVLPDIYYQLDFRKKIDFEKLIEFINLYDKIN